MGHAHAKSNSAMTPPAPPPKTCGGIFKKSSSSSASASKLTLDGRGVVSGKTSVAERIAAFSGNKTSSSPAMCKQSYKLSVAKTKKLPRAKIKKSAASFSHGSSSLSAASFSNSSSNCSNGSSNGIVVYEPNATAGLLSVKKIAVARMEQQEQTRRSNSNSSPQPSDRSKGSYNTVWQKRTIEVGAIKKPPPPVPNRHIFYEALYDFEAEQDDELEFREGDKIRFLCKVGDGEWLKGYAGGREGIFPASYAKRLGTPPAEQELQRRTSWVASGLSD